MKSENPAHASGGHVPSQEERRRSVRVTLRVGVKLHVSIEGKPPMLRAFTANVSDHGALLIAPENFPMGARFILEHERSRERIGCHVTRKPQATAGGFQIAVEFDRIAPGLWHIVFPPVDWKAPEP